MKLFVMASICLPRLVLDCMILYLGCRWLVATSSWSRSMDYHQFPLFFIDFHSIDARESWLRPRYPAFYEATWAISC